ncbi:hypothetical protein K2173_004639 [Erythroxylum novogranatense]|uniref:Uncharacterized protein ycf33 n=1 Tax=Erythroxylum novogranatense TaxID=1862640 RepID=A0AAV8SXK2_9ROSI|nr:hypothetical protein K2173_004639 [Erythroxylum novogranatense]
MKNFTFTLRFNLPQRTNFAHPTANLTGLIPPKSTSHLKSSSYLHTFPAKTATSGGKTLVHSIIDDDESKSEYMPLTFELKPRWESFSKRDISQVSQNGHLRFLMLGGASLGLFLLAMGMDDQKALALGPEGPLMEEFWDNVRRYALYALTVSTGALYTILLPIVELLKNPISAILVLVIFGGSLYIVSQVLYAMVGVSEFSYDYGY